MKKIKCGNTVAIHSVLKKKTTKLNSQPAQYEKKKSTKTILEKKQKKNHKKGKKTMWRNTVAIDSVLKRKKLQS